MTKVLCENASINVLLHISDIHIRLYQRLDEYEYVFKKLYEFLETQSKETLIVITGDLLHHKNELSPECIVFTSNFLQKLASYLPVILIAGNHDALLNNANRMDSISAILPLSNDIHYLKYSGFYRYGNIVFGVSSLLDGKMTRMTNDCKKDYTYVALYHGGVGKYQTNKGFQMEGIPLSIFDGYDFVMLGDIHMHQYLESQRIAYAGSMISQSFTETDENHGVLIWDVQSKKSQLSILDNPYAFSEAFIDSSVLYFRGIAYSTFSSIPFPKKGRIHIHLKEKKASDIDIINKLKRCFPDAHITEVFKMDYNNTSIPIKNNNTCFNFHDLVREYMRSLPSSWKDITLLTQTVLNSLPVINSKESAIWELLSVEYDYMFGYGSGNKIDLSTFTPYETVGIFGNNSVGKSSLAEIIVFLLFGVITRYTHGSSVPREVIHFLEKKSKGSIEFRSQGKTYRIEKSMTLTKSNKIKVIEKLWLINKDGTKIDLSEEHRKKTDSIVSSLIGTCDQFLFTSLFLQQNEMSFRNMSPRERKDFLYQILGLNAFETLCQENTDLLKNCKQEIDHLGTKLKILPDHAIIQESLSSIETQINNKQELQFSIENELSQLRTNMNNFIQSKIHVPDDLDKQMSNCKKRLFEVEQELHTFRQLLDKDVVYFTTLKEEYNNILNKEDILEQRTLLWTELENLYKSIITLPQLSITIDTFHHELEPKKSDINNFRMDVYQKWVQSYNMKDIDNFYKEKDMLMSGLQQVDPSSHLLSLTSNQLRKLLPNVPVSSTELHSLLNQLEEDINNLEKEWSDRWKRWDVLESTHESDIEQVFSSLIFNKDCSSCGHNECLISKLDIEKQRLHVMKEKQTLLTDGVVETRKQYESLKIQRNKIYNNWKETIIHEKKQQEIHSILHNKKQKKKIKLLLEQIKQEETYKTIDETWKTLEVHYKNTTNVIKHNSSIEKNITCTKSLVNELDSKSKIISDYMTLRNRQTETQQKITLLENEKKQLESESRQHDEWVIQRINNQKIDRLIKDLIEKEQSLQSQIRSNIEDIVSLNANKETWQSKCIERKEYEEKYDKVYKQLEYFQHMVKITGRDGLPMFLLEKYLPVMEESINSIIQPFMPNKKLVIRKEQKKESVNILLSMQSHEEDSVYLGGMESFIVDIAVKIIFSRMSNQPRSNLFIIDEGISALDKKNMENIDQLFDFLEQYFPRIFIISHLHEAISHVRHALYISKTDHYSCITLS